MSMLDDAKRSKLTKKRKKNCTHCGQEVDRAIDTAKVRCYDCKMKSIRERAYKTFKETYVRKKKYKEEREENNEG